MNDPAIETRGLRKAYGPVLALASLDLRVGPGEVGGHGRGRLDDKALTALMIGAPRLAPSRTIGT